MRFSDIPFRPSPRILRQFAAGWLVMMGAVGVYQAWHHNRKALGAVLAAIALVIGFLGLLQPKAVRWLFVLCMVLAFPVGWVVSQLTILLLFFLVLTPVALIFRLRGRDLLRRKLLKDQESFWTPKRMPEDPQSYLNQY